MVTFSIKADTPDETKAHIVKWLRDQAINHGIGSRMAVRKRVIAEHKYKSDAYNSAADFIELIKIEPKGLPSPDLGQITNVLGLDESQAKEHKK